MGDGAAGKAAVTGLLRRLFGRQDGPPEPGSSPEERRPVDLSSLESSLFAPSADGRYAVSAGKGGLSLELRRGSLFAWTDFGSYSYADLWISAAVDLGLGGGEKAAGFIVRKADDSTFACALISSQRRVRLDLVFNGLPRPLVPWIACPWAGGRPQLDLVVRGPRYVLLVDGRLALEAEDDALSSGGLAFAGQSYGSEAAVGLSDLEIESRPIEVEVAYHRFARVMEADPAQRRALAEAQLAMGNHVAALVHLRKLGDAATARDRFLEAESLLGLSLYDEASESLEACLAADPGLAEAAEERYNLLYLRGRHQELQDALGADAARLAASPRLRNLLGHAKFGLGDWAGAASDYAAAAEGEPGMPIYLRNLAGALEKAGDRVAAAAAWLRAAEAAYAAEAWADAAEASARLRELGYDKAELDSLDGLIAYAEGDADAAKKALAKAFKKGRATAPAAYAYGMLLAADGLRAEALEAFRRAAGLDDEKPIYKYRVAEAAFLAGLPCSAEVRAALAASPGDGWTLNLAGRAAIAGGELAAAIGYFGEAARALPSEPVVAVNLAHALSRAGRRDEALDALGAWPSTDAGSSNLLGTILSEAGRSREAIAAFEAACRLGADQPDLDDYRVNLASALIAEHRLSDAEDVLRKVLERGDDPGAMVLMAAIAAEYGDLGRSELAYRRALELEPGNAAALGGLARQYLARRRPGDASALAARLQAVDPSAAAELAARIREATVETIACASCGRAWETPKPVPAVKKATVRGEPPDDAPAGSCPSCGKVYCVACRKAELDDGRFTCPSCGARLNLNDDRVRWLVLGSVRG